jgi:Coenzyme PQQ synthesis protein D (PqqD)
MTTLELNRTWARVSLETTVAFDDHGIVILDARGGRLFRSNGVGAAIWQLIDRRLPFEAIVEAICQQYPIAQASAREHTARFVTELERHGLIVGEVAA